MRSGVALIENTMYQPIPTSEYFDGMAYEEPLGWKVWVDCFGQQSRLTVSKRFCHKGPLYWLQVDILYNYMHVNIQKSLSKSAYLSCIADQLICYLKWAMQLIFRAELIRVTQID